jgi:uncharacterized protein (TIGR02453 family)
MAAERSFSPKLFAFVTELAANNNRAWFQAAKARYEEDVQQPALQFVSDFGPRLKKISRHFVADPRPVGGSLFRIHRDTRFAKDKTPYKTHVGIHFRHEIAKDAYAPGFYLHLEPGNVFAGAGIWHPPAEALAKIRHRLVANPRDWRAAIGGAPFQRSFEMAGESLTRSPKGFAADHPLIDDLKRKDFIAVAILNQQQATGPGFLDLFAERCEAAAPLVRYVCRALGVDF